MSETNNPQPADQPVNTGGGKVALNADQPVNTGGTLDAQAATTESTETDEPEADPPVTTGGGN